jgi:WD40 repeat protein
MKNLRWSAVLIALGCAPFLLAADKPNVLTDKEKKAGFELLFNGKDLKGWEHAGNWKVVDGAISRVKGGGYLTYKTKKVPDDFELRFEWKVARGSNSGIYYRPGQYEYQILDNKVHSDGKNPRTSAASLYFCMAPSRDATKPVGQWNTGRIVCKGTIIQHWLNGERVIDFDYSKPRWASEVELLRVRGADLKARGAYLSLQDHGDPVWYRGIKLRTIPRDEKIDHKEVKPMAIPKEYLKREKEFVETHKKKKKDKKDKKSSPLADLSRKLSQQIAATAPPAWKARKDLHGDPLPRGATARLGTARFRHSSSITCVAYSPDGKWLAVGGSDNKIRLFDPQSGKELRELAGHQPSTFVLPKRPSLADFGAPTGKAGWVTTIAFDPDSKILASGGWDDAIRLWDVATGRQIRSLSAHRHLVSAVVYSPDGNLLASRGGLDGVVRLWEPKTGKEIHVLGPFVGRSAALAISPNSKTIAVGDRKIISLRDAKSGKETGQLKQPWTLCLAYSSDGKHLAAGGRDSTLRIWDVAKGAELRRCAIPKKEPPTQLAFSPDGKELAAAVKENNALLFNVSTGKPAHVLKYYWPDCVAYAPKNKRVAFAGAPSAVRIWDTGTGKELPKEQQGHQYAVTHVAISRDGKTIASGGDNLRLWDARGKITRTIDIPGRYVEALALSPDGEMLATGGRDKTVRLWDVKTGNQLQQYKHPGTLRAVAFSPDGKKLASGDLQLNIRLWDVEAKKELHKIKVQATFTDRLSLAFSPDGKTLACGGALNADWPRGIPSTDPYGIVAVLDRGYPVQLFDVEKGKEVGRLDGLLSRIRSLAYSPDGKLLAAASSDGRIALWDAKTRKPRLYIAAHPENIDSSFRSSPCIAFSANSKSLVSVSTDRTIRLWDVGTGEERGRLEATSPIYAVALPKDGKGVVTGHADASVLLWDGEFLARARPQGRRNFSIGHIDLR